MKINWKTYQYICLGIYTLHIPLSIFVMEYFDKEYWFSVYLVTNIAMAILMVYLLSKKEKIYNS